MVKMVFDFYFAKVLDRHFSENQFHNSRRVEL